MDGWLIGSPVLLTTLVSLGAKHEAFIVAWPQNTVTTCFGPMY